MDSSRLSRAEETSQLDDAQRHDPRLSEHVKSSPEESTLGGGSSGQEEHDTKPIGATSTEELSNGSPRDSSNASDIADMHASGNYNIDALASSLVDHLSMGISETWSKDDCIQDAINNAGSQYRRFLRSGTVKDVVGAIICWKAGAIMAPDSHADKPGLHNDLGCAYLCLFEKQGNLLDLEKSIECGVQAVSLSPDNHTNRPSFFHNLGNSYRARFEYLGDLADLNNRIECTTRALSLILDDCPNKASYLANLGFSFHTRFGRLGELGDLDQAIEYVTQAVSLTPDGDTVKSSLLHNLGILYETRFERLDELVDLNKAIECGARAVSLIPDSHPEKPRRLDSLGSSYEFRFERLGELVDLNKALEYGAQADSLAPDGHTDKPSRLNRLVTSLVTRFEHFGDPLDLNKAIMYGTQAVLLSLDGSEGKVCSLNNLGISYRTRFECLGNLTDINKAIECGAQAVLFSPKGYADRPGLLTNLGNSYRSRFEHLGELPDLDKAIDCGTEAVSLRPDGHSGRQIALGNLGGTYHIRFGHSGDPLDLNKAIEYGVQSVSLAPGSFAHKLRVLNNLGLSYQTRFDSRGDLVDLDKAIEYGTQAVMLVHDGHAVKPGSLSNLSTTYLCRFKHLHDTADLEKAIACGAQAVSLTPGDHGVKSCRLRNLGNAFWTRHDHSRQPLDLESAISCFISAAQCSAASPFLRFFACRAWAEIASDHNVPSAYPAYQKAMELLPQLVWIGTTIERRYRLIKALDDFATEAAAYAIAINEHDTALEWLEAGRSIVWGQIAQLRTPLDQLSVHDPELASKLREISRHLEHAGSRSVENLSFESIEKGLDKEASSHIQLALDWDTLLDKSRSIPGFEGFLQSPQSEQLLKAAKNHPVAVINIHRTRCDALILQPNSSAASHVPLKGFSIASALVAREHLATLVGHRGFSRTKKSPAGSLDQSLKTLWLGVVKPVLDFLGYTRKLPVDQLPRITWCTTGMLSFLPLHAAGCYDQSIPKAFDLVISSYAATISSLLVGQSLTPNTQAHCGLLVVGQEQTPGYENLPCVKDELEVIKKHAHEHVLLQLENDEATVEQVLDAMDQFSWVHLACHGTQSLTDPTQSAFHLCDGNITLAEITKRSFRNKGLAFLSACQTATGDKELPEEAVHLAAGMLMAGFPSVIGTMWSIADEDGPLVADWVYAKLLRHGELDHTKAAEALHQAVAHLRARVGEKSISRWGPFIHIGC